MDGNSGRGRVNGVGVRFWTGIVGEEESTVLGLGLDGNSGRGRVNGVGVRFWTGIVGEEESTVLGLGFGRE